MEWQKRVNKILASYQLTKDALDSFKEMTVNKSLHRFANILKAINSTGNDLIETKNACCCFDSSKLEDCRYVSYGDEIKDCLDSYAIVENSELCYEHLSARAAAHSGFVVGSWGNNFSLWYSQYLVDCQYCFGCMALKKKRYSILNKQYTKEKYEKLVPKIIEQMNQMPYIDKKGRVYKYGEFFPVSDSSFGYNETTANDYFPLTKAEVIENGYNWRDDLGGVFGEETLDIKDLPDSAKNIDDSILDQIIACLNCRKNFKITKDELGFYRALKIPLPRKCPDCRYIERLLFKNPRKLWERKCMCAGAKSSNGIYTNTVAHFHGDQPCPHEFETTYSPDRPEIVYCEKCYQSEVV